jgi:hypothetical protein
MRWQHGPARQRDQLPVRQRAVAVHAITVAI